MIYVFLTIANIFKLYTHNFNFITFNHYLEIIFNYKLKLNNARNDMTFHVYHI